MLKPVAVIFRLLLCLLTATAYGQVSIPASLDFGSQPVGTTTTLTVNASGRANALVFGTAAGDFGFAPGFSADGTILYVSFTPSVAGTRMAQMFITDRTGGYVVSLTGSGTLAGVMVTLAPLSAALPPGGSTTFTATVSNAFNTDVTWITTGGSIAGTGNSVTYTAPASPGIYAVTAASVADPTKTAGATVTVATISPPATMLLSASPASIAFGSVVVGSSASQVVTLTNTGASAIDVSSASTAGPGFSLTGLAFPFTLAANASQPANVVFAPSSTGAATGSVSFVSSAANSPVTVTLSGDGILPAQHTVTLSWQASPSLVAGYNVYRTQTSGGPYARVNGVTDPNTTFTDSGVQSGQTYYYVVTAVDGAGTESGFSNQAAAVIPTP